MEHCNICNIDVEDVDVHIRTPEHLENLEKIKNMFKSKLYGDNKSAIDIRRLNSVKPLFFFITVFVSSSTSLIL